MVMHSIADICHMPSNFACQFQTKYLQYSHKKMTHFSPFFLAYLCFIDFTNLYLFLIILFSIEVVRL